MKATPVIQNVDPPKDKKVLSYHAMRRLIGTFGLLLPFALLFFNYLINKLNFLNLERFVNTSLSYPYCPQENLKDSISHYYYTAVGELFVGMLCAVAFFLFCYRGYPQPKSGKYHWIPSDRFMSNLAAIGALGVAIFPTGSSHEIKDNIRTFVSSDFVGILHYISAAIFFLSLSVISFVNFRRAETNSLFGTKDEHDLFKYCGIIMFACLVILFTFFLLGKAEVNVDFVDHYNLTFWLETIALLAFGTSWLVKGKIDEEEAFQYVRKMLKPTKKKKDK